MSQPTSEPTQDDYKVWGKYRDALRTFAQLVIEHGHKLNQRELNMVEFFRREMARVGAIYSITDKDIATAIYSSGVFGPCKEVKCILIY